MNINWDAVGAIGELASAMAVVITLIYLGKQLAATARQQRIDGNRAVSEEFNRINDIWRDERQTGMLIRAWNDWDTATPQEQHLTWLFFVKIFNHTQTLFTMWQAGSIDESVYQAEEEMSCQFLSTNGGTKWWALMANSHSREFVERINSVLASTEHRPITEQLPFWQAEHWPR